MKNTKSILCTSYYSHFLYSQFFSCSDNYINEIQWLAEECSGFDIYHVKREANIAAHKVAKFASESNPECA